jgi:hypothetical protein
MKVMQVIQAMQVMLFMLVMLVMMDMQVMQVMLVLSAIQFMHVKHNFRNLFQDRLVIKKACTSGKSYQSCASCTSNLSDYVWMMQVVLTL